MTVSRLPPTARSVRSFQSSLVSKDNGISGTRSQITPGTTLAKRLLFPHLSPDAEVPPLLSSPNLPPELNAEIYDFVALALRAFVNPWWTKISRYDKEFLVQINQVATQVVRSLETRLSNTDLSPLIFRDLPTIITQHYEDYRLASSKLNTSYSIGGAASLPQLFHQFQPHMAVSADGSINEDYLRQSVDFILKASLPPDDYDPDAERYITREVILKVLIGVIPRISQPWFIHKLALDLLGPSETTASVEKASIFSVTQILNLMPPTMKPSPDPSKQYISFHAIVVFVLSSIQAISGFGLMVIHGYKSAVQTIKHVNESSNHASNEQARPPTSVAPSTPPLTTVVSKRLSDASSLFSVSSKRQESPERGPPATSIPDFLRYADPPLTMITTIFNLNGRYAASAIAHTLDVLASLFMPFLDKFLPYLLYGNILSPSRLVDIIRTAKKTLFPNGYLAPPPIDPAPEEQVVIQERLVARIQQTIPGWIAPLVLGAQPLAREQTIRDILDPLSSAECNSHLVMFILDSMLMTLIPEMGSTTDASMMDGPPTVHAQPQPARTGLDLQDPSGGNSNDDESGKDGWEKGKDPEREGP